jgi:hypothetical protein
VALLERVSAMYPPSFTVNPSRIEIARRSSLALQPSYVTPHELDENHLFRTINGIGNDHIHYLHNGHHDVVHPMDYDDVVALDGRIRIQDEQISQQVYLPLVPSSQDTFQESH